VAAASRKCREATVGRRTGWSLTSHFAHAETLCVSDHPVRSIKVASQHFLDVASTPPHEEGNKTFARQFIHTFFSRLLHSFAAARLR